MNGMKDDQVRTILVTGGTGFLGSSLLKKLIAEPLSVILLTRSSSDTSRISTVLDRVSLYPLDREPLERLFRDNRIDTIIHCAVDYGRNSADPGDIVEANLILPLRLLALAKRSGVSCFMNTDTVLGREVSRYALSKSHFREWLRIYAQGMTCVNVALELFYGPGDHQDKFLTRIVRGLLNEVESIDLTRGEQKRDFIYIDDAVEAFLTLIRRSSSLGKGYSHFEAGTGRNTSIRECVARVKALAGNARTRLNFGAIPYREHEVMESHVDSSALRELGWMPRTSLDDGLRQTIEGERLILKKERGGSP